MMILKAYSTIILSLLAVVAIAQHKISGVVTNANTNTPLANVEVYNKTKGLLTTTNAKGYYEIAVNEKQFTLVLFSYEFDVFEKEITVNNQKTINVALKPLDEALSEVELIARKAKVFEVSRLKDVEETAIYAGKKNEVVLVEQSLANLASNNARQIYAQVAGLNIFQNDDAGLQLNIGGRGLDPNRTSNFNTRQNGYDISADVLGYPESYYTPPAEALSEIQIIRGAASLQYGTQFGGLVNFKFKQPNSKKALELVSRYTTGSNRLYTNFTSISGTKNKFSYYAFYNYKQGEGFRENSKFNAKNAFVHLGYTFNAKTKLTAEFTYLTYLAQQAGGLTDKMFAENPFQSNRTRNWFTINWLLYNVKFKHQFSDNTTLTLNGFGLQAQRGALGFLESRPDQIDAINPITANYVERDLIKGQFKNIGFETRLLTKYQLVTKKAVALIGAKFYKANNTSEQGPGSNGTDAVFNFEYQNYSSYKSQSNYKNPNLNVALFGENVIYLSDKFSVTPGFRVEYIKTESRGFLREVNTDAAGNVIYNKLIYPEAIVKKRQFALLGVGASYKPNTVVECYANISQNYRSVTFSDLNIVSPVFVINPNISDETGFTSDLGVRGTINKLISYDANVFSLFYNNRIGFVLKEQDDKRLKNERNNIGDAFIYGIESLLDFNLKPLLFKNDNAFSSNVFVNMSFINSEYTKSEENDVKGKKVEFVPNVNLKTGLKFSYKNIQTSLQYTYLGAQFTDATNAKAEASGISAIIGEIPEYAILDASLNYTFAKGKFKLETGVNNVLNKTYFTRRATGYPGPGIIPSPPRNVYATLQVKLN